VMIGTYCSGRLLRRYYCAEQKVRTLISATSRTACTGHSRILLDAGDAIACLRHRRAKKKKKKGQADPIASISTEVFTGDGEHGRVARNGGAGGIVAAGGLPLRAATDRPPVDEEDAVFAGQVIEDAAGPASRRRGGGRMRKALPWTLAEFKQSQSQATRPGLSVCARCAVVGRQGRLGEGAQDVMDEGGKDCAWVHAYLHESKATGETPAYWYTQRKAYGGRGRVADRIRDHSRNAFIAEQ